MTSRKHYYAGIGSRTTPNEVFEMIQTVVPRLAEAGYILRSGGAPGADTFFEAVAVSCRAPAEIFLPWPTFENRLSASGEGLIPSSGNITYFPRPTAAAMQLAQDRSPSPWGSLSQGVQAILARNVHQILGPELDTPVDFVLCWTPGGKTVGGTAHAIRLAKSRGIPVHNLFFGPPEIL